MAETPETPTPGLAERLEAEEGHPDGGDITLGDLRDAAAQLRQLDRIKAALGDVPDWIDAMEANIGNHCTVMSVSAQADLVTLFRRLADALEDTDAD